jgi:protein-tyrosine phosphatase
MAEGIFRVKVKHAGLEERIHCDSCGTSGEHDGENPDRRAIRIAKSHGVDLSSLISRKVRQSDFSSFHYFIPMDEDNESALRYFARRNNISEITIHKMREFDPTPGDGNVPDPWYGNEKDFEFVFRLLDRSCDNFLQFIREKHGI